jgi:transcriptional regulator with PAS, ATPase and Fis domain
VEKNLILQALEKAGQNKTTAAKLLGITYDSLRYQVKKLGLE